MENKKAFDRVFEERIPQAILVDNIFGEQIMDVFEIENFSLLHTKEISRILKDFYTNHKSFPSVPMLESIVAKDVSDETLKKRCVEYLNKIKQVPPNGDLEYVKEKTLEFFRLQTVANCLSDEILPLIEQGKLDGIVSIFQNALQKGTSKNIGYEYLDDEELRFIEHEELKISSGWPYLDTLLGGGFGPKRLVTYIGAAGAGKSSMLVGTGCGALLQGKTVVHYTLELDEMDVARKYDACITGVDINSITGNKSKVLERLKSKLPENAKLIIKEYPMKSASVQTIKSHLSRLKLAKGIVPDVIVIDYGDLLRNVEVSPGEDKRHGLEAIWQDMKALAQTLGIPVITATQTNRSGYAADIITPDQVSEDFSKIMTSDIIVTLARNMAQKIAGLGKMYLAKNRQGEDGIIYAYRIDTKKCQIEMFKMDAETEAELNPKEKEKTVDIKNQVASFMEKVSRKA